MEVVIIRIEAKSVEEYILNTPKDKREALSRLRMTVLSNIPEGFEETISYNMIGYVVPLDRYSKGYRNDSKIPLPFVNIAAQKNFIGLYHMGVYAFEDIKEWFIEEYSKSVSHKLDMGKSCIRFKKLDDIPYELIGELVRKISVEDWIEKYEAIKS